MLVFMQKLLDASQVTGAVKPGSSVRARRLTFLQMALNSFSNPAQAA
jgi:hypothetical protein